jgi:hypothetical protein
LGMRVTVKGQSRLNDRSDPPTMRFSAQGINYDV